MTLTARLSGQATPAPTSGVISASRGGQLTATFTGVPTANLPLYVAFGQSSGAPGTYASIVGDVGGNVPPDEGSAAFTYRVANDTYDVSVRVPVTSGVFSTPNDLWAALFFNKTDIPDPTDVPDAAAGPIAVVA